MLRFRSRIVCTGWAARVVDGSERTVGSATISCCTAAWRSSLPARGRGPVADGARRPDEQRPEVERGRPRARLREHRDGTGGDGCGDARAAHRSVADLALVGPAGLRRGHGHTRRDQLGLCDAGEREPARGEGRDAASSHVLGHVDRTDRDGHRDPRRDERTNGAAELGREADDRDTGRHGQAEGACGQRAVDEDRARPGGGGLVHGLVREPTPGEQRSATGDRAGALLVEEATDSPGARRARDRDDVRGDRLVGRAAERKHAVEENAEPGPHVDAHGRRRRSPVRGRDRQGGRRPAGPGDAPERRAGTPVVPRGDDDERVERRRAVDRTRERPVRERRIRLREADERDPRGIVGIAIVVRVDSGFEPCEHLVGAGVDGVLTLRIGLPACDADREDGRARRDAVQSTGPVGAGHDPGELRPVPLRPPRDRRMGLCDRAAAGSDDVDAGHDARTEERVRLVDTRVEERDDDSAAVDSRHSQPRHGRGNGDRDSGADVGGRGVRDAHGVDRHHLAVALEQLERRRVEPGGDGVQDPDVAVFGGDLSAARRHPPQELLLRAPGGRGPTPHLHVRRRPALRTHAGRQGGATQDHDVALSGRDIGADPEHALPPRLVDRRDLSRRSARHEARDRDGERPRACSSYATEA